MAARPRNAFLCSSNTLYRPVHGPTYVLCDLWKQGSTLFDSQVFGHADAHFSRKITGFLDQQLNYVRRGFMSGPQYAKS
jgi:hypothetical protein